MLIPIFAAITFLQRVAPLRGPRIQRDSSASPALDGNRWKRIAFLWRENRRSFRIRKVRLDRCLIDRLTSLRLSDERCRCWSICGRRQVFWLNARKSLRNRRLRPRLWLGRGRLCDPAPRQLNLDGVELSKSFFRVHRSKWVGIVLGRPPFLW